jgi:hypothetical protein
VTVEQTDGTTRSFSAEVFWRDLFMGEVSAAVGEASEASSAVHEALAGATPEAEAKIKAFVESEGGDFLAGRGSDVGFGVVGPDFEDLSEPAHSDEDPL